jgi:hypothetical protein
LQYQNEQKKKKKKKKLAFSDSRNLQSGPIRKWLR